MTAGTAIVTPKGFGSGVGPGFGAGPISSSASVGCGLILFRLYSTARCVTLIRGWRRASTGSLEWIAVKTADRHHPP